MSNNLSEDSLKLVREFGATEISKLTDVPEIYTFEKELMYSHRDFDSYYKKLKNKEKAAIVSGFNASATPHIGHIGVFDTNLLFQKKYGVEVFIPISDDESYVSLKVKTQEESLKNSIMLAKAMIAYGFERKKTRIIIDQLYSNIYNLAFKFSRGITLSQIKAVYGYAPEQNVGLHFYPAVQSAHIILPQTLGTPNVLVPIGPDEDAHLRVCRDIAEKFGYVKPAVLHSLFLPGIDGAKMSKSRNNGIFLLESEKEIRKKVMAAFSGGRESIEAHRKHGGDPNVDVAFIYLRNYFLKDSEARDIAEDYRKGRMLSGEMKLMLLEKLMGRINKIKENYEKVTVKDLEHFIMTNEETDLPKLIEKLED
ncbi:MAG: tryptophan--tRNA ligase [Candidatus Micrarchaeota archaeon]|nr:tryptophan--tRNA ligase [Candidatus Micrarchaeota archaeon]